MISKYEGLLNNLCGSTVLLVSGALLVSGWQYSIVGEYSSVLLVSG